MSHNANDYHIVPAAPSFRVKGTLQVTDAVMAGRSQIIDIAIDREVPSCTVVDYKTHFADTLDAWRFRVMLSNGGNLFIFDLQNVRRVTYIGAWARRWMILRRWCSGMLKTVFGFHMLIVRHAQKVMYHRRL